MEFQQMSDEKKSKPQESDKKIEIQYMDFYANFQIMESDQVSSDLDDLEALHENIRANNFDICCHAQWERDQIRRNPRVAEIPTVYLVTCIRTEYLPKRSHWRVDSEEETKLEQCQEKQNYQSMGYDGLEEELNMRIDQNGQKKKFHEFKHIHKQSCIVLNCYDSNQKNGSRGGKACFQYERLWKTDYAYIGGGGGPSLFQKENKVKKVMHIERKKVQGRKLVGMRPEKKENENCVNSVKKGSIKDYSMKESESIINGHGQGPNQKKNTSFKWERSSSIKNKSDDSKYNMKINQKQVGKKFLKIKLQHYQHPNPLNPESSQSQPQNSPLFKQTYPRSQYQKHQNFHPSQEELQFQHLIISEICEKSTSGYGKRPRTDQVDHCCHYHDGQQKGKNKYKCHSLHMEMGMSMDDIKYIINKNQ